MNKNKAVGVALVILAAVLSMGVVTLRGSALEMLIGQALWYVPYVVLVSGIVRLVRTSRGRVGHGRTCNGSYRPFLGK